MKQATEALFTTTRDFATCLWTFIVCTAKDNKSSALCYSRKNLSILINDLSINVISI